MDERQRQEKLRQLEDRLIETTYLLSKAIEVERIGVSEANTK